MWEGKRVSLVFPAYNEEKSIKKSIDDFFNIGVVDEVIVVDNNSNDKTSDEIKKTKAKLFLEKNQGYGFALIRGLKEASGNIIITCEPDGTFVPNDIKKLLVYSEDFDVVFGSRTSKWCIWENSNMGWFLRIGNWFIGKILEYMYNGPSLTDVGCTFKLIKREQLDIIKDKFCVGGSSFSPEFMILCIKNKCKVVEIPLNYRPRIGESKITGKKTKAFKLGLKMIWLILAYRFLGKR